MMGLKQEMDRTAEHIERIDYRFAERAGEIEEDVESCVTRVFLPFIHNFSEHALNTLQK